MTKNTKYYKQRYGSGLKKIKEIGVVTQEQAVKLLECDYRMLPVLVSHELLCFIRISRVNLYSADNDDYSNKQMRRSVLLTQFKLDKKDVEFDKNIKVDNSLRQQQVIYICNTPNHNINHYLILGVAEKSYTDKRDYQDLVKLVKDIYFQDDLSRLRIYYYHNYSNFNYGLFLKYLKADKEIGSIDMLPTVLLSLKSIIVDIPALRYI